MTSMKNLVVFLSVLEILCFTFIQGAHFEVVNQCPYTVWAAASPGGGKRLENGQTWQVDVQPGMGKARVWGRTGCTFDANGRGKCVTGDCNGMLECHGHGSPPNTIAELALSQEEIIRDFVDISLVEGFNIPMEFKAVDALCKKMRCTGDINGQCPAELRTQGGCNNPCTVFKTVQYCCTIQRGSCGPTKYSKFFKDMCPDAYSYPQDTSSSLVTCPSGSNYKIVFCP